ncbi:unnamed protein product [Nesidiocoris tenuis]|uniref:Uncharacterized protein n=1 Tax=Nesidiocoris tenuis TaxID=355587 RepID=A0A6H5H9R1_9HEMI|nr:unnamed protein product [Nesidiocoris tenuis]
MDALKVGCVQKQPSTTRRPKRVKAVAYVIPVVDVPSKAHPGMPTRLHQLESAAVDVPSVVPVFHLEESEQLLPHQKQLQTDHIFSSGRHAAKHQQLKYPTFLQDELWECSERNFKTYHRLLKSPGQHACPPPPCPWPPPPAPPQQGVKTFKKSKKLEKFKIGSVEFPQIGKNAKNEKSRQELSSQTADFFGKAGPKYQLSNGSGQVERLTIQATGEPLRMLMDASLSECIAFSKESTRLEAESDVKFETDRKDFSKAITVMEAGISNSKQTMNGRSKKSNAEQRQRCRRSGNVVGDLATLWAIWQRRTVTLAVRLQSLPARVGYAAQISPKENRGRRIFSSLPVSDRRFCRGLVFLICTSKGDPFDQRSIKQAQVGKDSSESPNVESGFRCSDRLSAGLNVEGKG